MGYQRQIYLILFGLVMLAILQYQYWFGNNGNIALKKLDKQIAEQIYANNEQAKANQILLADIHDLKNGLEAVEEHARVDLGYIKQGETFIQMSTIKEPMDKTVSTDVLTPAMTTE